MKENYYRISSSAAHWSDVQKVGVENTYSFNGMTYVKKDWVKNLFSSRMKAYQVNKVIAEIQLARYALPSGLDGSGELVDESDCTSILTETFSANEVKYTDLNGDEVIEEINLISNWNNIARKYEKKPSFKIMIAVINRMISTSFCNYEIKRLQNFLEGNPVPKEWEWSTIDGKDLTGLVFSELYS